jgi:hypothetical protein
LAKGISWGRFHKVLKISLCYEFAWFSVRHTLNSYLSLSTGQQKVVKLERAKTDGQDLAHASCLDISSNLSQNGDGDFNVQYNKVHVYHLFMTTKACKISCIFKVTVLFVMISFLI